MTDHSALHADELLGHLKTMWVIRKFEEALDRAFAQGLVRGTCHLCVGQEASAVGACAALAPDDQVTSNHRGHGHLIAKGGDPRRVMAELLGKATGYAGGRGGTQHMACLEIGFLGSNGITGGGIPLATGAALAAKLLATGRVVLCFFGDGATAQGAFHEAVNMGALWKLPVIYYCENNLYAMSTRVSEHSACPCIAEKARAYRIPSETIDGNDFFAVLTSVSRAAARARAGDGPTLIEALTYRYLGHSKSDRREYRTREEEEEARARDGIARFCHYLTANGLASESAVVAAEAAAEQIIADALAFARDSPYPTERPESLVYV